MTKYVSNQGDTCVITDKGAVRFTNAQGVSVSACNFLNLNKYYDVNGSKAQTDFVNAAARNGAAELSYVTYQSWKLAK